MDGEIEVKIEYAPDWAFKWKVVSYLNGRVLGYENASTHLGARWLRRKAKRRFRIADGVFR